MRRARLCAECGSTPRFWFTLRMASEILIHPGIGYGVAPSMRLLAAALKPALRDASAG